jgi:hypothetical protein
MGCNFIITGSIFTMIDSFFSMIEQERITGWRKVESERFCEI